MLSFIIVPTVINISLLVAFGVIGSAIILLYWLVGILFVAVSEGPSEDPGIFEAAFHGSLGGLFTWFGFRLGYSTFLGGQKYTDRCDSEQDSCDHVMHHNPTHSESLAEELGKLKDLHDSGALTIEQFESAKAKVLDMAA